MQRTTISLLPPAAQQPRTQQSSAKYKANRAAQGGGRNLKGWTFLPAAFEITGGKTDEWRLLGKGHGWLTEARGGDGKRSQKGKTIEPEMEERREKKIGTLATSNV